MSQNHDHSLASIHALSYNTESYFHHPLGGNVVKSSGAHAVDIQAGHLFVAAYGASADADGGVWIFDLKDPKKPVLVGTFRLPGNLGGDRSMEVTEDGKWILLGTEATDCAGHVSLTPAGLYLIDARDKSKPVVADFVASSGVHSVIVKRIGGTDYVFALMGGKNIHKIVLSGAKPTLEAVGSVSIGHDGAIYDDPILKAPILYAADGNQVLRIYNVSNPAAPTKIGEWAPEPGHYVHAAVVEFLEGQRIIIVESEDWLGTPSPMWIINGTDIAHPELIGTWVNPGNKPANAGLPGSPSLGRFGGQLIFSTHNPRIERGIVYLTHYHGGIWFLNVSAPSQWISPHVMGYYLPHNDNGGFVPRSGEGAYPKPNAYCGFDLNQLPLAFDVEVKDGIAYVADLHTGIYAVGLRSRSTTPQT